jgi:hypothetical protein
MTLFNGDKTKPRILGCTGSKNFYWVLDFGSAVTCMNINSFETAFGKTLQIEENFKIDI